MQDRADEPVLSNEGRADRVPHSVPTPLYERLVTRFESLRFVLKGLDGRTAWVMLISATLLVIFRKYGRSSYFEHTLRPEALANHPYLSVYGDYYWFAGCFVLLGLLPALLSLPRPLRPPNLGLGIGDWRFGLTWTAILLAIMLPVVAFASGWQGFWQHYPLNAILGTQAARAAAGIAGVPDSFLVHFVGYELLYGLYFIGWEYFFRGFMVFGLYARLGVNGVFVATIPFALLHAGKPFPEAIGSIVAGVALGLFALRARSFWYCWVVHAIVAWTMDGAAILRRAQSLTGS